MEALAILLAVIAFVALLSPEIKPPPPSPADQLMKGLKAAYNDIVKDGGGGKKEKPGVSPWTVMLFTVMLGILFTYIL